MNAGTGERRWRLWGRLESPSPRMTGLTIPTLERVAGMFGLAVAIVSLGCIGAARAGAADSDISERLVDVDTTQSEFERLMAVARNTRQGSGSEVHHLAVEGRPEIGSREAPLTLIEIASFECPYCRRHWLDTMPALQHQFIDEGRLRYVFVDVVIDPGHTRARAAAEAAHCANQQGRYVEFRNRIYRNQKAIEEMFLEAHAKAVALDMSEFRSCMESGRYRLQVENDTALARRLRVRGTPSFFWARSEPGQTDVRLVHRVSGIRPIEEFARQFDALHRNERTATTAEIDNTR